MNTNATENNIGFLLKQISDKMRARADADMRCSDLTYSQLMVLGFIEDSGGESSQKEIEEYLGVSHPTTVGLISRLKAKDLVKTSVDPDDRRVKRIYSTEKARLLSDFMAGKRELAESALVSDLTDEEAAELRRLLCIVYESITETD